NQKGRVGQRRKSAVGATEDLDTDKMPTVRDSSGATQPGVCPPCCFFCHSNLIKPISGRNVLGTGVSSTPKVSSE
ncbi:mCG63369, isoform CRA_a, partial [Mus musculus]